MSGAGFVGEAPLELWGGAEYTCNRVRDCFFDQMKFSGHAERVADIELFAELGIRTLRCGLLWERHEQHPGWRWEDERMEAVCKAGVRPIAGLLHHGSGPAHTSLVDPSFAEKLARYAGEVAARYPWIDAYTPVNEPNTTARFSGLYGVWYPHQQSRKSYLCALLGQMKATVLSMQAIRAVNSEARLVQTDDMGRIFSTLELGATADLMNERRWLGFDLLCGTVDRTHPMFRYLTDAGLSEDEVLWFRDHPCPPDVIGVNYYLTSDRFLDHRWEMYPGELRSAEGPFVDVETVRVQGEEISGFAALLREASDRYRLPVALTEVHLGDCVQEQIRWIAEAWQDAQRVREEGVKCVAVTLWALLGSFFWNSLVTGENGHYEPGVFRLRDGVPESTELAEFVRGLARGEMPRHPALHEAGWWRRECRVKFQVGEEVAA